MTDEIEVTKAIESLDNPAYDLRRYSDSVGRSGLQNIGDVTWRNAQEAMAESVLCDDADALVDYFEDYGAWPREELEAMSLQDLNALLLQFVAGDAQEYLEALAQGEEAFREYDENQGGRLHHIDEDNGRRWFYYIGS